MEVKMENEIGKVGEITENLERLEKAAAELLRTMEALECRLSVATRANTDLEPNAVRHSSCGMAERLEKIISGVEEATARGRSLEQRCEI
ncbi:MAG: hypothetical protein GY804_11575 [Alphaproteobacteria bacterium]|nr:hypothetical protein [Alphaproteobacteria bacterium]